MPLSGILILFLQHRILLFTLDLYKKMFKNKLSWFNHYFALMYKEIVQSSGFLFRFLLLWTCKMHLYLFADAGIYLLCFFKIHILKHNYYRTGVKSRCNSACIQNCCFIQQTKICISENSLPNNFTWNILFTVD